MGTRRPRTPASRLKRGAPAEAPGRSRPARAPSGGTRPEDPARVLQRLHARRLRACASLDIPVPPEAREGTPATLVRRIAMLDRRIEVSLDLAGGRRFAPWDPEPDEEAPDDAPIPEWPS